MRTLYFLLPGTSSQFTCGGLFAELKTLALAQQICEAAVVTYQQREANTLFLDDLLQTEAAQQGIFVVSWGFHVPKLVKRLRQQAVVYHAHSAGYGFRLPSSVPILAVSRNTMGYWGQWCPSAPIFLVPNQISPEFSDRGLPRDIDVLVQVRKSSQYLLTQLVPALQQHCNVVLIDRFVDDLAGLFNRSKVYLYDTAEYWAQYSVTEGFGLPPMEAMACGCQVFSSVNGALADYLDPGFNCQAIGVYSTAYDTQRILAALQTQTPPSLSSDFLEPYQEVKIVPRLRHILTEINAFFDHTEQYKSDILPLSSKRINQLRLQKLWKKVMTKMSRDRS
ncbi:glycosyltransferase [Oscillatoria sp. CS-180]|uniref:glycosyltransferase n=1 Tax=Oscillatoria sp. CS-180 TaxID=3021720 RepID=UPI00232E10F5|nr:glycosyltransferase [Oscillatoria sp. CS-180]MDB9527326.1 glycosyltransferase [Oscillatoria sp. CS-180]